VAGVESGARGPMSLDHDEAAMWVDPHGTGSRCNWEMTIESNEAAEPMRAMAGSDADAA
jgi:hypothetical protein